MSGTNSERHYLSRLMAVLETICDGSAQPTYRDIALKVGLPLSTTHRLVALLTAAGLCGRQPDGKLAPGVQLVRLGLQAMEQIQPLPRCQDLVQQLSRRTNESVSFGMLAGGTILLVARHECEEPLRAVARVGDIMPPQRTAMGKAILAHLPDDQRLRLLRRSVGSEAGELLHRLRADLDRTLECGYAVDDEEFAQGLRCLAAPVFDEAGGVAGAI
ncbi:MAG TPA: IclR family transcriptional regulator, partial [Candidatus Saccharimonadales bacterium]|nr:IclR family transcriptional regulator [Candidatus Saccharimonadales bacterium]